MRSPLPFRLKKLRLEAADSTRVDFSGPAGRERDQLGERDQGEAFTISFPSAA
jgi:hypothetical protein